MSKGSSHLFSGTSGEGKALIDEVIANGYKISPEKVVLITRDPTGKIVWLEEGNSSSGLQHIIDRHGHEFNGKGIANSDIPDYVLEAVYQGNIVGTQGKRNPPEHRAREIPLALCMNLFTTDKPNELPFKLAVTGIL